MHVSHSQTLHEWIKRILIFPSSWNFLPPWPKDNRLLCEKNRCRCFRFIFFFSKLLWISLFFRLAKKSFIGLHSFTPFLPLKNNIQFDGGGAHTPSILQLEQNMADFFACFCLLAYFCNKHLNNKIVLILTIQTIQKCLKQKNVLPSPFFHTVPVAYRNIYT